MYLADYHLHSTCSPDARDSMEDMIAAARAAGLDEICFTEHVEPLVWGTTQPRGDYDWTPLSAAFAAAKATAGNSIRVRLGIELGDAPWSFGWCETMLERAPELDFVIGSIHTLSPAMGCDLFRFPPADEAEARAAMADYLGQVEKLARWGRFQVLGHLTLPLRYFNELRGFHLTFDGFEREIETILKIVVDQGKGIEVNTNRHLQLLLNVYEAAPTGEHYAIDGIDCYLTNEPDRDYQFIIYDCGVMQTPTSVFREADHRLLCGSVLPYEIPAFHKALEICGGLEVRPVAISVPGEFQEYCRELFGGEMEMAEASHNLFAERTNGRLYKRLVEPYIMGERWL